MHVRIRTTRKAIVSLALYDLEGRLVRPLSERVCLPGTATLTQQLDELPAGTYTLRAIRRDFRGGWKAMQTVRLVKGR